MDESTELHAQHGILVLVTVPMDESTELLNTVFWCW
jgi:hypothetical protein